MLKLERHLSEDKLLALRDRRDDDFVRRQHLEECPRCQKRFAFLSAFKTALEDAGERDTSSSMRFSSNRSSESHLLPSCEALLVTSEEVEAFCSESEPDLVAEGKFESSEPCPGSHPEPATLAAYVDDALPAHERREVKTRLAGCERCMADVMVLAPGGGTAAGKDIRAVREHFRDHGTTISYRPGSPREVRPQLNLGLEEGSGTAVLFRILARSSSSGRSIAGRDQLDERVEVMVGTARVTVTAHRIKRARFIDVQVRDLGRRVSATAATVSVEEDGRTVASLATDRIGKASLPVPAARSFDLRVDGGWTIPVLLRFRS